MQRLLAVTFLVVACVFDHAALAQQQFDGRWSIEATPAKGACRRTQHYTVVVEKGVARNAVHRRTEDRVTGRLEPDGRIRVGVQRNGTRTDIAGKLAGHSGSGTWTITGRIACSGRWIASKWG
jgi:hypothetical protein